MNLNADQTELGTSDVHSGSNLNSQNPVPFGSGIHSEPHSLADSDGPADDTQHTALSGSAQNHLPTGCEIPGDEPPGSTLCRNLDISSRPDVTLAAADLGTAWEPGVDEDSSGRFGSRRFLSYSFDKRLPLFARKEFEAPRHGLQKDRWVSIVEVCSRRKSAQIISR
jgi:hypothetical protein